VRVGCWTFYAFALVSLSCTRPAREVRSASDYGIQENESALSRERPSEEGKQSEQISPDDVVTQPPDPLDVPKVMRKLPLLGEFYENLDALRNGTRKSSVRILWLGDSHTAADFMTHPVREHLSLLGGNGGPGFVRLGLDGYRHGAARFTSYGKWRKAPILPAQRTRVLDGVFGYGGIRTLPASSSGASVMVRSPSNEPIDVQLLSRLPPGSELEARFGQEKVRLSATPAEEIAVDVRSWSFHGRDTAEFSVHHVAGDPQVFGAFVDYSRPGVVLDTVGIDGARAATVLAWEPEQFVAHVRRRAPELLVVAFGTNEVFDQTDPTRYVEHNEKLVELVRQARPGIPCWVIGPPDSATTEGNSKARVQDVTAALRQAAISTGCAFTSAYELMGGEGSFARWVRDRPAKARSDRIHLTIHGYETLGRLLAHELVEGEPLSVH
jgi:lysophospholipase L1-like esterase